MTCDHKQGDICLLELFGGKPKQSECDICPAYSGRLRGMGDVIARAVSRIGLTGKKCGRCGERRARLNKILPTGNK